LASAFRINRLHFSEKDRINSLLSDKSIKSTSTHSTEEFNALESIFDYAFLSPIYPSISKPDYFSKINHLEAIKKRINFSTKLIALGGISSKNILTTLENGFNDVALLGSLWNSKNPLIQFKKCQQIVLSYSQ
jgi:thiamine-phosphate pyrophosphorylase